MLHGPFPVDLSLARWFWFIKIKISSLIELVDWGIRVSSMFRLLGQAICLTLCSSNELVTSNDIVVSTEKINALPM